MSADQGKFIADCHIPFEDSGAPEVDFPSFSSRSFAFFAAIFMQIKNYGSCKKKKNKL